jgi:hypothetical protein
MNDLAFFSVLILTLLRFTGVFISVDFLLIKGKKNQKTFYLFTLGWVCWIIGSFLSLLSLMSEGISFKIEFIVLHDIAILLGALYMILAMLSYFRYIQKTEVLIGTSLGFILPLLTFFIFDYYIAEIVIILLYVGLFIYLIFNSWIERHNLRLYINNSIKWFHLTILLSFFYAIFLIFMAVNGEITGLSILDDPILITNYSLLSMAITLLVLILTTHLECSLSNIQKYKMKDNYSHKLGNLLQMILNSAEVNNSFQTKGDPVLNDLIIEKCHEANFLITEIREL